MISLDEAKHYLRVDSDDEDSVIQQEIAGAEQLVAGILRLDDLSETDSPLVIVAVLYALAYLNEHREEADHHALSLTLRAILSGMREGVV